MDIVFFIHCIPHILFLVLVLHYIVHFFATEEVNDNDDDKNLQDKKIPALQTNKVYDSESESSEEIKHELSKAKIVSPFAGYGINRTKIVDIASSSESLDDDTDDLKSKSKKALKKKTKKKASKKRTTRKVVKRITEFEDNFKDDEINSDFEKDTILTETIGHENIGMGMGGNVPFLVLEAVEVEKKNSTRHNKCTIKESFATENQKEAKESIAKKSKKARKKRKRKVVK